MYKIIKDGNLIALTEEARFICKSDSGCSIRTDKENAQGIVVNGTPYNLLGVEPLDENFETVWVVEVNGGEIVFDNNIAVKSLDKVIIDQEYRIALLGLGLEVF